ncbi:3-hydroxyisobutyryl-CoA hydrolase, mitochondrial isoform X2 [Condylostylus longicornis]|uniref:3-hydroxyisobutyryl-CoA hydrolase, mitochondrial isoform X2 n=2 Tax=Condylostylus longicornis TaxID=2530218 RepID=UPI00244E1898|nr:3-hydroxyisobutyryl-CoA hydrolase, mitochondrial isoform X2 [Condylostylus longicornis]
MIAARQLVRNLQSNKMVVAKSLSTANTEATIIANDHPICGILTVNRPKALNALNLDMVRQITKHLKTWERTKSLVIVKGAGEKSFCAGGDVRAIVEAGLTEESKSFFREEYQMNALIGSYRIPYIAFIDGITMGGGVGLSVHGKYRVATERTMFAMPETAIGLFPDVGGSYFLPRLQGNLGLYLGLTGYRLKGEDVLRAGIATHYCESSKLNDLEKALTDCKDIIEIPNILSAFSTLPSREFVLQEHLEKINKHFSKRSLEEILKSLEKDGSKWAESTLKTLLKMSPTSLKVSKYQLELGSCMSLQECLKMEYRMVLRFMEDSDFKEGVRALLIDKDQKPNWKPNSVDGVTEDRVNFYFAPLPLEEELQLDNIYV